MIDVGEKWAPTKKLVSVIEKIYSLLMAPNLDTPLND
jgi:ubiquitin-protein ligase